MEEALSRVPARYRNMRIFGRCAEIGCLNQALQQGRSVKGAVLDTRDVGVTSPGHGEVKPACGVCRSVIDYLEGMG